LLIAARDKAYSTRNTACNDFFVSGLVLTPDNASPMNETIESPSPVRDDRHIDAERILDVARTRFDATEGA
jgi:hypothetical protein